MGDNDDVNFQDLLVESLTQDGVLAKVRAQLRAHIYIALENENKVKPDKSNHFENDYATLMFLIYDFLKYIKFEYTLSVFEAESDYANKTQFRNENDFYEYFNIKPTFNMSPLLMHVFQTYKKIYLTTKNNEPLNSTYQVKQDKIQDFGIQTEPSTFSDKSHSILYEITQSLNPSDSNQDKEETSKITPAPSNTSISSHLKDESYSHSNDNKIENKSPVLNVSTLECNKIDETYTTEALSNNKSLNFSKMDEPKYNSTKISEIIASSPNNANNCSNLIQFDDSISNISELQFYETPKKNDVQLCDSTIFDKNNLLYVKNASLESPIYDVKSTKFDSTNAPSLYLSATNMESMHMTSDNKEICDFNVMNEEKNEKRIAKSIFTTGHLKPPKPEHVIGDVLLDNITNLKAEEEQTNL